ncbi:UNVERIFIED_CONTAM: hypothetical protein K2H54_038189 [Gekko kuhli]
MNKPWETADAMANNNSSVLTLSNNNLSLNDNEIKILHKNPNIIKLYLNNNAIVVLRFPPLGKSWKFLIGVLIVIVTTTLLIITAIKVPLWYRHLISYNHSRLDEDEPGMFEEHFSTDMCSFPPEPDTNENDSIVVFEQFHTFVPEDDGFIEDKYIDT